MSTIGYREGMRIVIDYSSNGIFIAKRPVLAWFFTVSNGYCGNLTCFPHPLVEKVKNLHGC